MVAMSFVWCELGLVEIVREYSNSLLAQDSPIVAWYGWHIVVQDKGVAGKCTAKFVLKY